MTEMWEVTVRRNGCELTRAFESEEEARDAAKDMALKLADSVSDWAVFIRELAA